MASDDFTRLVDAHYASLFRFALSLTRSTADAADLTQQTFLIWAQRGSTLRNTAKAKTWLFTTLYREFLRHRHRDQRSEPLETSQLEATQISDIGFAAESPAGAVMEALQRLDEAYRTPLTLFYLREFSYKEIAELLGLPIGTVMSRLSRGKAQLAAMMAESTRSGSSSAEENSPA